MFRHFVIALNILTFSWSQIAFAAASEQMTKYNEFLKDSGITQHPVALKDLVAKFGKDMPEDVRTQWEALVKENPSLMMPKIDAKKILINGEDELQLNVNANGDNLIVTTKKSNDVWATIVGTKDGKAVNDNITSLDLLNSARGIHKLREKLQNSKQGLLSMEVYKKMEPNMQVKYLQFVRQKLVDIERVQNAHAKLMQPESVSVLNLFFQQALIGEAFALTQNNCVVAGNTDGTFTSSGFCHSNEAQGPNGRRDSAECSSSGMLHCNALFYGDGVCVPGKTAEDFKYATVNCDKEGDPDLKKIATKLATSEKDVFDNIDKMVNQTDKICYQDPVCKGPSVTCKANIQDQKDTCQALVDRRDHIKDLFCSNHPRDVEAQKKIFEEIGWDTIKKIQARENCPQAGSPAPPAPAPVPPPPLDACTQSGISGPVDNHCDTTQITCMDPATKQSKTITVYKDKGNYVAKGDKCELTPQPVQPNADCDLPQAPSPSKCSVTYITCKDGGHTVYGGDLPNEEGWALINHPKNGRNIYACEQNGHAKKEKEDPSFWNKYGDDFILGGAIVGIVGLAYWANKQNLKAYRNAVVGTTTTSTIIPSTTTTTPTAPTPGSYHSVETVVLPGTR